MPHPNLTGRPLPVTPTPEEIDGYLARRLVLLDLARRWGCSENTAAAVLRRARVAVYGDGRRRVEVPPDLAAAYARGELTQAEVGRRVGRSQGWAGDALRRAGVPAAGRGGRRPGKDAAAGGTAPTA